MFVILKMRNNTLQWLCEHSSYS